MTKMTNRLIEESSPYLLQHAYNPVDWYPWGKEALERAQQEDKPILLSIGYSACHWCHVMERESFEKQDIATLMNNHFVCIKLDREERPDIDQIYMDAVQAMGIAGGWPLNVFLTPQQNPFYGGTYFPAQHWSQLLVNIAQAFRENRQELDKSSLKFREALNLSVIDKYRLQESPQEVSPKLLEIAVEKLKVQFDTNLGGTAKAPKFPMPAIWNFLLHYHPLKKDQQILDHLYLTLDKMALGGIYDQIGGGFARYSVDEKWFAPHFEKMLYDNAQLLSLYSQAYSLSKSALYKSVVYQTIDFLTRELRHSQGAYYAALDADSEGEEGKFYVWSYEEFESLVGDEGDFLLEYFGLTPDGNWEHGQNILFRSQTNESFAAAKKLDPTWIENTVSKYIDVLLEERGKRIRPGLDHKIICGWNGLMIKGLTDAYAAFGEPRFLDLALNCAEFIEASLRQGDQLIRSFDNREVFAYLEDYAAVIEGYIGLYQVSFDDRWIYRAQNLTSYLLKNFWDEKEDLFFYTDKQSHGLIARKKEVFDNVIPASNSIMAHNLTILGTLLQRQSYLDTAKKMVAKISPLIQTDPAYLSNWATALTFQSYPLAEIAIMGEDPHSLRKVISSHFHPHKILLGSTDVSDLPTLEHRLPEKGTKIYVCYNQTCQLPTDDPQIAIEQLSYNPL